ncbi:MAG: amidohydrolase family protein [Candidatus Methanoperedens sp.]|nr:amidohydrolase family protein [Candidatus Methanoperedens sp.]
MEQTLKGTIIYGDEFEPIDGYITIEDGKIINVEESAIVSDVIIAPCFVNAHTHIGDSVIKDPPFMPLSDLVAPPDGLKHRILRQTPYSELLISIRATIGDMIKTGTCAFCDFREGGLHGASVLKEALGTHPGIASVIFGRPEDYDMNFLDICQGTGLSSTNDLKTEYVQDILKNTREKGKKFAIHAGEKDSTDISGALSLSPDFLVHLTKASDKDIKTVADSNIPVVVCPRSNYMTRSGIPPIQKMIDADITVAVGTDNVMLNSANMFSEMEFLVKTNIFDDRQVFKLCTLNGAKLLGIDKESGSIIKGKKARLMILTQKSDNMHGTKNPLASLVRRARPDDIIRII